MHCALANLAKKDSVLTLACKPCIQYIFQEVSGGSKGGSHGVLTPPLKFLKSVGARRPQIRYCVLAVYVLFEHFYISELMC